jgi:hypothetical protein
VAVVVVDARADRGDPRLEGIKELLRRSRARPVVGDLQQVDARRAGAQHLVIDVLLEVAHQQEPVRFGLAEEHDREVVDGLALVERCGGDIGPGRPEDAQPDAVEPEAVARGEPSPRRHAVGELRQPPVVPGARPRQARLVHRADPVAVEQQPEPRDVVLVWVRQDDDVDPSVPRRQALVERDEQAARIRPAVDEHPATMAAVDEDRVALPDVQDHDVRHAAGSVGDGESQCSRGADQRECHGLQRPAQEWWVG